MLDHQALVNTVLAVGLLALMALTAWAGGVLVVAVEATCAVAWRSYRGRAG